MCSKDEIIAIVKKELAPLIASQSSLEKRANKSISKFIEDMEHVQESVAVLQTSVESHNYKTDELIDILESVEGFFKTLGWIGKAVKWISMFAISMIAIYQAAEAFVKYLKWW